ncbi:MAG: VCBS repeat-containing protein [Nocardioidaceae bacterium]|nr:VCBS repeat-containing protein [Nocardioidaceae bacterium]
MPPLSYVTESRRALTAIVAAGAVLAAVVAWQPAATAVVVGDIGAAEPAAPAAGNTGTEIDEVALSGVDPEAREDLSARALADVAVLSPAVPASGYTVAGVTWSPEVALGDRQLFLRTETAGTWSAWQPMEVDAAHAPDADSNEGKAAVPGTEPFVVGEVDAVQVKMTTATTSRAVPTDLTLSVIDPDVAGGPSADERAVEGGARTPDYPATSGSGGVTSRPGIFSRSQWGANESMRDGFAGYGEVHGSFVHHTVNANGYSKEQVPSILRGIYAYHTQSRGWSDIGYNYLVDRFGRLWEGRWGGVDRPVIGAHTLGYNDAAFAMSAIGNFDVTRPSDAMVRSYGRLFAWKLSLHGVQPKASATINGTALRAVNGHRDAGQTACPGRYLYDRIPAIRRQAAAIQAGYGARELRRTVASTRRPDVLQRAGDSARVLAGDSGPGFRAAVASTSAWSDARDVVGLGDLTDDRRGDVLVRYGDGTAATLPGTGDGGFGTPVRHGNTFADASLLAGGRDLTGDGAVDVVFRTADGVLRVAPGVPDGSFGRPRALASGYGQALVVTAAGDADSDGDNDLLVVNGKRRLLLLPGNGDGTVGEARAVRGDWSGRTVLVGGSDLTRDGRPDLLARDTSSGKVKIFPGRGNERFARPLRGWSGWETARVTLLGDANGDRLTEALVRRPSGSVSVHPGRGGAWVHPVNRRPTDLSGYSSARMVGDWNGDGDGDVLALRRDKMWLFAGRGNGSFANPTGGWAGWSGRSPIAAVGDWDGDGRPDLMSRDRSGAALVHPGRGRKGFARAYQARSDIGSVTAMFGVGRWNADGAPDLMTRTSDGSLLLWPGNGPGGLEDPRRIAGNMGRYNQLIGVGDLNRDGRPDLVGRLAKNGQLFMLPGRADGLARRVPIGSGPVAGSLG